MMKKLSLFLALDVDTKDQVFSLVKKTYPLILGYKIGPRLFLQYGKELISEIKTYDSSVKIFLDFKFYDIPSSTLEAVRSAYLIGADYVTVHASVGEETLKLLATLEKELGLERFFKILPLTVLSSVEDVEAQQKVEKLADLVVKSGLSSLVCSPLEVQRIRQKYKDILLVTPGIRMRGNERGDQKRVMTPEEAFKVGSSILVMGRSLIESKDISGVLKQLSQSI